MYIRPSKIDDIAAASSVAHESYSRLLAADYPRATLAAALPHMASLSEDLAASGTFFVVEADDRIVALGVWSDGYPTGDGIGVGRANVRKLAVHPEYLRRGIGAALMAHIHATAQAAGQTWMHCLSSLPAVPFYAAQGYDILGASSVITTVSCIRFDVVEMRRDL